MTEEITSERQLQLGQIGVTLTYGSWVDREIGGAIRWFTATTTQYHGLSDSPVNHAVMYVGDGKLVQAEPGGARLADWDSYGHDMIWLDTMYECETIRTPKLLNKSYMTSPNLQQPLEPTDAQRMLIASAGKRFATLGIQYNYLDFLAIARAQQRFGRAQFNPLKPPWWAKRLADNTRLICSQLCDYAWTLSGVHLYNGRLPGLVSPEDLFIAANLNLPPTEDELGQEIVPK